jgi:predicted transcriptional regulator YdeE
MKNFTLNEEIEVMCVAAESFPEGIAAAHQKLDAIAPVASDRRHFGISRGDGSGGTIYKAAAEEKEAGEAEKLGLERFTIRKGKYAQERVENFMRNIPKVAETFKKLLAHPELDPNGYCLEWYLSNRDMKCMVKLKD